MTMKVNMTAESKRILTVEELPVARSIIRQMKEDETSAAEYIRYAVNALGNGCAKVYEASAEIAKNCRVWNAYDTGTGTLDIWIEATARTWNGFVEIGAYLTDIWNISDNDRQTEHFYVRTFTESK